jgi:phosphatidylglycerol:prolipoprotein diacylglycerol transferase
VDEILASAVAPPAGAAAGGLLLQLPAGWDGLPSALQLGGFLTALAVSLWLADRRGLEPRAMYWAGAWGIAGAVAGSLVWSELATAASAVPGGGRSVLGAFLGAGVFGGAFLRWRGRPLLGFADAAVPAIALGYAIARLGCLAAGDDFGVVTDAAWGLRFGPGTDAFAVHLARGWIPGGSAHSLAVQPTQIYHAAVGLLGFVLLLRWCPRWSGSTLAAGLAFYGLTRFLIQFLRDSHWARGAPIDPAQWVSLGFIGLALGLWWSARDSRRAVASHGREALR